MSRAILVLLLAPLAGCFLIFPPCGSAGDCPPPESVAEGVYFAGSDRTDVTDAEVEIAGDDVWVRYVDDQGNTWEVAYEVTDRVPQDGT